MRADVFDDGPPGGGLDGAQEIARVNPPAGLRGERRASIGPLVAGLQPLGNLLLAVRLQCSAEAGGPRRTGIVRASRGRMTERKQRPTLRAVKDGGAAAAAKSATKKAPAKRAPRKVTPVSVTVAARSGDHRKLLAALANRIAQAIDDPKTAGPALAALIKQQRDLARDIQAIDAAAIKKKTLPPLSVIAMTPDEAWDESMI